jgi:dihydroxy-acid dehydratase
MSRLAAAEGNSRSRTGTANRRTVGLANSWLSSGRSDDDGRKSLVDVVKDAVFEAGGLPVEFRVLGACNGLCAEEQQQQQQHSGQMLPISDLIASSVGLMVSAGRYDGLILMGACDNYVAGLLKAAASLDLPTVLLNGGPFRKICASFEGVQANYLSLAAEAMGLSMPGGASIPGERLAERMALAQAAGRAIVSLIDDNLTARRLMTSASFENAARLAGAIGGLEAVSAHLSSLAVVADVRLDQRLFDRVDPLDSLVERLSFSAADGGLAFWRAGGVQAALGELKPALRLKTPSVAGRTVDDHLRDFQAGDASLGLTV